MQIAGDARPLGLSGLEKGLKPPVELAHPQEVRCQNCEKRGRCKQRSEPPSCPPSGLDPQTDRHAWLAPRATIGGALDSKPIGAGGQSRIARIPAVAADLLPGLVETFKLVAIPVGRGTAETEH